MMIEGLKLDFSSADLKSQVASRAAFHSEKAKWYRGQIESLRAGGMKPENISNDPVTSLERSMTDHEQKTSFFQVIADHIVNGETYRLGDGDLARLEFVARYF